MNNTLISKASTLIDLRTEIKEHRDAINELEAKKEKIQDDIIQGLKKAQLSSIKTTDGVMVSKQIARSLSIVDEGALIKDLKKRGLNDYVKEKVDGILWRPFSTRAIKEGITFNGTELKETEYISIRGAKED